MRRTFVLVSVVAAAAATVWFYWTSAHPAAAPEVRASAVTRGPVVTTVTATGTTDAVTSVSVGSQVSGTIASLGADFNSVVKKGQVIARLDPALLQAQVDQARANLIRIDADLQQSVVGLADKQTKLARAAKLAAEQLVSASDLGDATMAVEVAKSDVESAKAQVAQAKASLNQAQLNLSHAVITAPIDGTVIQRNVDVGQTVAASLSSPTLFVIAADLAEMRASLSVDESDISQIVSGQPVTITVSAYPGERFRGEVSQVRLQPVVASNVTTYTTVVAIANPDLKLKPGMTASAQIEIARRDNVLRVPNAALRFVPTAEIYAALGHTSPEIGAPASAAATVVRAAVSTTTSVMEDGTRVVLTTAPARRPDGAAARTPSPGRSITRQIWTFDDGILRAIPIRVGLSDATNTEVLEDGMPESSERLAEGDAVVTGVTTGTETVARSATPASSSIFGGGTGRGGGPR
jgi:HlyD family secretion protein